jgi:hypothetical protein
MKVIVLASTDIQRVFKKIELACIQALNALHFALVEDRDKALFRRDAQDSLPITFDPELSPVSNLLLLGFLQLMIQCFVFVDNVINDVEQEGWTLSPQINAIEVLVQIIPTAGYLGDITNIAREFFTK